MIIGGNYTQTANGTLELSLGGNKDLLEMKGAVKPNGKLRLKFSNNYVPEGGAITIITHGKDQRAGEFSSVETVGLPSQYKARVTYHSDHVELTVEKRKFSDITDSSSWAAKAIDALASAGILQGTSDGTFSPSMNISRADLVVLLVRALNLKAEYASNFNDVNPSDYYYESLGIAKQLGLANGVEGDTFEPSKDITREDLMLLCARALKLTGSGVQGTAADLSQFPDSSEISSYAAEGIASLVKQGIVEGKEKGIDPHGKATRAETATMIYRIIHLKK
ncbi:S-layer homology domain-containing protein [Paenibacillus sp. P26]|nr:S-layer homology domain-containing protein [Paenibacillus sp. P26]UUZ92877.1 S-layer homology domain-containing protein [Paenibacillus sp. P25]